MLALHELQQQFIAALFDSADERAASHIVANGVTPAERLEIYRNNLREGFTKALAIAYPVIERLVGSDYFRQLALEFQKVHPSRAGNLHHTAAPFPAYLRERFADTEFAYLTDVAALERAHEEALIAADAEAITGEALRRIEPDRYEHLHFELHSACSLVRSVYPIVRIWQANQPDAAAEMADTMIDLDSGGDNVLVLRSSEGVEFHLLPAAEFAALEALACGEPLGNALDRAQAVDPDFDLGATLGRFLTLRILSGVSA